MSKVVYILYDTCGEAVYATHDFNTVDAWMEENRERSWEEVRLI